MMSPIQLDDTRRKILAASGHLLIKGGPGSGKTTIALLKARQTLDTLGTEQRVLFLSFSRAAVRQISDRMQGIFDRTGRDLLEVRTFHSFFMDLVRSHGQLLTGRSASFIYPDRERQLQADFNGDWKEETKRLALQDGRYVFDRLAYTAATLLERSKAVRALYNDAYPLIIVDEFQDTNTDQWRAVQALGDTSTTICLADPDQRIFDHLEGVDEARIAQAIEKLQPIPFDLESDNHRSPGNGLLDYANAVLRNDASVPVPRNIGTVTFHGHVTCEAKVHEMVVGLRDHLERQLGREVSIAVLAPANRLVGRISEAISTERKFASKTLPAIDHELHWDPELSAAAGYVVASILEWPGLPNAEAIPKTLRTIANFYRIKLADGTQGARRTITTIERSVTAFESNAIVKSKTARVLIQAFDNGIKLNGDPVSDWRTARGLLTGSTELNELFNKARLLRLFKATDALAWALVDAWDGQTAYVDASGTVQRVLASETLDATQQEPAPVSLMSIHRAKSKEFDGVIIAEGAHGAHLLDGSWDHNRVQANRRLLRVGITRARHMVAFVRPYGCVPLTGGPWR